MTDEGKEILSVAAAGNGHITFVRTLAGTTSIGTVGKGFIPPGADKRTNPQRPSRARAWSGGRFRSRPKPMRKRISTPGSPPTPWLCSC